MILCCNVLRWIKDVRPDVDMITLLTGVARVSVVVGCRQLAEGFSEIPTMYKVGNILFVLTINKLSLKNSSFPFLREMLCYHIFDTDIDVSDSRLVNLKRWVKRKGLFCFMYVSPP